MLRVKIQHQENLLQIDFALTSNTHMLSPFAVPECRDSTFRSDMTSGFTEMNERQFSLTKTFYTHTHTHTHTDPMGSPLSPY